MTRNIVAGCAIATTLTIGAIAPATTAFAYDPCTRAIAARNAAFEDMNDATRRCARANNSSGCPMPNASVERAEARWYALVLEAQRQCR